MKRNLRHTVLWGAVLTWQAVAGSLAAQRTLADAQVQSDSDHDGLSDALEQRLLLQFAPTFMIGKNDCSVRPAEFKPETRIPQVLMENGTIYGQVFPSNVSVGSAGDQAKTVELHYYHLWRKDCGAHGHRLDTEHVAVLVRASNAHIADPSFKALYWYAAAHENTVCDVSQIARASTVGAEDHGATIWISPGKHASYLNATLCQKGCGADRCEVMVPLATTALVNLGEAGQPMNGSLFISSAEWPLQAKMSASNFPAAPLARLNQLPVTDIAWFNAGRHPAQGMIATSSRTEQALAQSEQNTAVAISVGSDSTGNALSAASEATGGALTTAGDATSGALGKSYKATRGSLGKAARHVGNALHLTVPPTPTPDGKEPAAAGSSHFEF